MKPVVAVVCDTSKQGPHLFHQAGDKYIQALVRCSDVLPVLLPSLEEPLDQTDILNTVHGILFTGGYSNIERHHYGESPAPDTDLRDPLRDNTTLTLVSAAVKAGVPILGICRGLQEMNVALGGSLYPEVHKIEGRFDHREDKNASLDEQYAPAHTVTVSEQGTFQDIVDEKEFMVNSLHGQAINKLAAPLQIEAVATDTTIEAVSVKEAETFAFAVQWHPEWQAWNNPQSSALFKAFGDAARKCQKERA